MEKTQLAKAIQDLGDKGKYMGGSIHDLPEEFLENIEKYKIPFSIRCKD